LSDWALDAQEKVNTWQKAFEETAVAVEAGQTVVKVPAKGKGKAAPQVHQDMGEPVSFHFVLIVMQ
jgi:DNA-binding protein YbaB